MIDDDNVLLTFIGGLLAAQGLSALLVLFDDNAQTALPAVSFTAGNF